MISQQTDRRPSLYDNIPVLDLWYQTPIASPAVSSPLPERKSSWPTSALNDGRRSVSFSTDPPSVHYIPDQVFDDGQDDAPDQPRNSHRRGKFLHLSIMVGSKPDSRICLSILVSAQMRSLARRLLRRPNKVGAL